MKPLVVLLGAALALPPGLQDDGRATATVAPLSVSIVNEDGGEWCSIRAGSVQLGRLLGQVAGKSGRVVRGLEAPERNALVTVDLSRRPLAQALEYVLGSLGLRCELRRDVVTVLPALADGLGRDEVLELASATWIRALTRYPDHPSAPSARLALGEIAELQGLAGAGLDHYQSLIERYPTSEAVGEAYLRSGRILARQAEWAEAAAQFRALANDSSLADYHAAARLELARCLVEQGNAEAARRVLVVLDEQYPSSDAAELSERLLVRARVLIELERPMEALRALDDAGDTLDPLARNESLRVRAQALEGIGLPDEAARAWLLYSQGVEGHGKAVALEQAARLALEADDELAVLFVHREASALGLERPLADYVRQARRRLGLDVEEAPEEATLAQRITLAEGWIERGEVGAAAEVLESLFLGRGALEPELAARVSVGWARCVERSRGVDEAVRLLAGVRGQLDDLELRSRIDVGAARLLERNGRLDEAIEAYRGNY